MGEAVQQCAKQAFILKDLVLFREGEVGSDEDGGAQVEVADQDNEHLGTLLREGDEAQFVNDDELLFEQSVLHAGELALFMGFQQLVDEVGGGGEAHLHALGAQGVAQCGGEVGFADADGACQDDVFMGGGEGVGGQFQHLLFG